MLDIIELAACHDCLFYLAYGDLNPETSPEEDEEFETAIKEKWDGYHLAVDGEEIGFSWRGCECCGSNLGGDRYKVNAWECEEVE